MRYSGDLSRKLNFVSGVFVFHQTLDADPAFKQEQGAAAAAFLLAPSANASTPGLLDGYGYNQTVNYGNTSAALFGQLQWSVTDRLRVLPGLRFNYDTKNVDFNQQVYGGLQTTNPALDRAAAVDPRAAGLQGGRQRHESVRTGHRRVQDLGEGERLRDVCHRLQVGRPQPERRADRRGNNQPVLSAATVKPEDVRNYEVGIKTTPLTRRDGERRGLRHRDQELPGAGHQRQRRRDSRLSRQRREGARARRRVRRQREGEQHVSFYGAAAYTDGKYVTFTDAPPPLEDTGGPQFEDISGSLLPGISKWAVSVGGEASHPGSLFSRTGEFFGALDASYRSSFSSSPSYSKYLIVPGYSLLNARVGFRVASGWTAVGVVAQSAEQGLLRPADGRRR